MLRDTFTNLFCYVAGIVFLALARTKYALRGYYTPTIWSNDDDAASRAHCADIVNTWQREIRRYTGCEKWESANVLELGPGATLNTGVLLMKDGASTYTAVDVFRLVRGEVPAGIDYVTDPSFRIDEVTGGRRFDLFVSSAAFEHFDDIFDTIERCSRVANSAATFCVVVDMQTHSRWIRDVDPNNIYRYSDWIYRLFQVKGTPNRKRPSDYVRALSTHGWADIQIVPLITTPQGYAERTLTYMHGPFSVPDAQMEMLFVAVMARRS